MASVAGHEAALQPSDMTPTQLVLVRGQAWLACTLAMIAGYSDAFGFLYYKTYVSFMSGNHTQFGLKLGQGAWAAAVPAIVAIVFFAVGIFAGTLLAHSATEPSPRPRFGLVAGLLAAVIAVTMLGSLPIDVGIATLSFAMGIMNTALSKVGAQAVAIGYVTGTLNALAQNLALAVKRAPLPDAQGSWDTHQRRAFLLLAVWAAFLVGVVVSAAANPRFGVWVLLLPIAILTALAVFGPPQPASAGVPRQLGSEPKVASHPMP
jgi:uncharacterized membrane protein YoaK (UPF0700 family)